MSRNADSEEYRPASVYALTCGCTLLLSGSVSDVVGSRPMYLTGCALLASFTLACGLSRSGFQLIVFRGLSGIAMSFALPSAVSIITTSFATGQRRNIAFAFLGASQPVGFAIGLVVGGILVDKIGWRYGYYIVAALNLIVLLVSIWALPRDPRRTTPITWRRLTFEVDWIGALLASTSLAMLSYVFACVYHPRINVIRRLLLRPRSSITSNASRIKDPSNVVLLSTSVVLLPAFVFWVGRQERLGKPAIVPNSLWRNGVFTAVCVTVFFVWAAFNAVQYFLTLYFQEIQGLSALQASIRFIPMVISGAAANLATGLLVNQVAANPLLLIATAMTSTSPLIMALVKPTWNYWYSEFIAILLLPVCADVLFTISNLVITSVFPAKTHGLAGGVFNTISQIGNSVGLAVSAVIASSVTAANSHANESGPKALLKGYQATYWTCFACSVGTLAVTGLGLRRIGKVGMKTE